MWPQRQENIGACSGKCKIHTPIFRIRKNPTVSTVCDSGENGIGLSGTLYRCHYQMEQAPWNFIHHKTNKYLRSIQLFIQKFCERRKLWTITWMRCSCYQVPNLLQLLQSVSWVSKSSTVYYQISVISTTSLHEVEKIGDKAAFS